MILKSIEADLVMRTAFAEGDGYFIDADFGLAKLHIPITFDQLKALAASIQEASEGGNNFFGTSVIAMVVDGESAR